MAVAKKHITAEEFYQLHLDNAELVEGEIIESMPVTPEHGKIAGWLVTFLNLWIIQTRAGQAGTEGGFILGRNPDKVREPDVWFLSKDRNPENKEAFWEVAPTLVAEVISPSDTARVIKGKLADYFAAGTQLVWLIYPSYKEVEVHTPAGTMTTFREADTLREPQLLPGFSCKVADLFAD